MPKGSFPDFWHYNSVMQSIVALMSCYKCHDICYGMPYMIRCKYNGIYDTSRPAQPMGVTARPGPSISAPARPRTKFRKIPRPARLMGWRGSRSFRDGWGNAGRWQVPGEKAHFWTSPAKQYIRVLWRKCHVLNLMTFVMACQTWHVVNIMRFMTFMTFSWRS